MAEVTEKDRERAREFLDAREPGLVNYGDLQALLTEFAGEVRQAAFRRGAEAMRTAILNDTRVAWQGVVVEKAIRRVEVPDDGGE